MLKFIKQLFCHHEYETIKVNGFLRCSGRADPPAVVSG